MANYKLKDVNEKSGEVREVDVEVRVYPFKEQKNNALAFASVTIGEMFGAHGLQVMKSVNGPFVQMPQTRDKDGKYRDVFHPVTADLRKELSNAVLAEYSVAIEELVAKQESTIAQIRETQQALKNKAAEKDEKGGKDDKSKAKGAAKKDGAEL